jgi:hypothetical protein
MGSAQEREVRRDFMELRGLGVSLNVYLYLSQQQLAEFKNNMRPHPTFNGIGLNVNGKPSERRRSNSYALLELELPPNHNGATASDDDIEDIILSDDDITETTPEELGKQRAAARYLEGRGYTLEGAIEFLG